MRAALIGVAAIVGDLLCVQSVLATEGIMVWRLEGKEGITEKQIDSTIFHLLLPVPASG